MATLAATITAVRRILNDFPVAIHLNGAIGDTTTETFIVDAADIRQVSVGQRLEHDDGGTTSAEQRLVYAVDPDTFTVSAYRGAFGSTAATHADNSFVLVDPRFPYDTVAQAVNQCLDYDLYPQVYEIVEHQVTSSATSHAYNAPATACEKWLDVYQRTVSTNVPTRSGISYSVYKQNVDSALWANGVFEIYGGKADGSEKFYVNCAHRIAIGTLIARQERLVHYCSVAHLLEETNPRRLAGPTNQGDRSVKPGAELQSAGWYWDRFYRMRRGEEKWLRQQVPPREVFKRAGAVTYGSSS